MQVCTLTIQYLFYNAFIYTLVALYMLGIQIYRLRFYNPFWSVLHNQLKGLTANHNGVIITLYSCADALPGLVFMLPDCAKLCGLCLRSLRAVLFVNHFYTLIFWQSIQIMQLLPVYYPCKRLFGVLQAFTACVCILSTATVKLILGTFTGFIMTSGYCIISRFTAL